MTIPCSDCGKQIDPRSRLTWQKVVGWERTRHGGGTNHVALRHNLDEWMCNECVDKRKTGERGQAKLW